MTNDEMTKALADIRDELVRRDAHGQLPAKRRAVAPHSLAEEGKQAASLALSAMLVNLNGWIKGARENHDALGHRRENRGEECWRSFAPSDIRNMVNDTARELGLSEFPTPEITKEDEVR